MSCLAHCNAIGYMELGKLSRRSTVRNTGWQSTRGCPFVPHSKNTSTLYSSLFTGPRQQFCRRLSRIVRLVGVVLGLNAKIIMQRYLYGHCRTKHSANDGARSTEVHGLCCVLAYTRVRQTSCPDLFRVMASAEVDAGMIHMFYFFAGKMMCVPLSVSESRSCMRSATGITGTPRAPTCVLPRKHQPQIADRDLPNKTDKIVLAPARCGVYAPCLGETSIIIWQSIVFLKRL